MVFKGFGRVGCGEVEIRVKVIFIFGSLDLGIISRV